MLGGSWVVISRVISRITIRITHIGGLITPLITTHEPPSGYTAYASDVCQLREVLGLEAFGIMPSEFAAGQGLWFRV